MTDPTPAPPPSPDPTDHDGGYHLLFSHPAMVALLLRTLVDEAFVDELNLDAMERVNVKYQAPGLIKRQGDIVWRIPTNDGEASIYLYLLLEFQSKSDRWMAVRLLVYIGLLYQQLLDERLHLVNNKLPPVFAVVLHNGELRWTAPRSVSALIALEEEAKLWAWQPALSFYVIDIAAIKAADLDTRQELAAALVKLEQCEHASELDRIVSDIVAILERTLPEDVRQAIGRAFTTFIAEVLHKRGVEIEPAQIDDLRGFRKMLEAKVEGLIYVPDNFTLTIESADRMFGALVSAVTAPAEFRRSSDGIS